VIKSAYSESVILEVILQTLRAVQHRKTLVIYGPRMSLKTSLFSTFIRMGLTDVHCPVKVDSFIVSQRWSNSSDSTQDKRVAERKFGRSLFRIVDEVDGQNGKAKFSVHLALADACGRSLKATRRCDESRRSAQAGALAPVVRLGTALDAWCVASPRLFLNVGERPALPL